MERTPRDSSRRRNAGTPSTDKQEQRAVGGFTRRLVSLEMNCSYRAKRPSAEGADESQGRGGGVASSQDESPSSRCGSGCGSPSRDEGRRIVDVWAVRATPQGLATTKLLTILCAAVLVARMRLSTLGALDPRCCCCCCAAPATEWTGRRKPNWPGRNSERKMFFSASGARRESGKNWADGAGGGKNGASESRWRRWCGRAHVSPKRKGARIRCGGSMMAQGVGRRILNEIQILAGESKVLSVAAESRDENRIPPNASNT